MDPYTVVRWVFFGNCASDLKPVKIKHSIIIRTNIGNTINIYCLHNTGIVGKDTGENSFQSVYYWKRKLEFKFNFFQMVAKQPSLLRHKKDSKNFQEILLVENKKERPFNTL